MRDKKLQVFVSSTYIDLIEERQAAVEAILSSGHIPAGMELFSAGDESQMTVIERWIDESDVYLLILGGRYGSIDKKTDKSYTHLEYEYALKRNKPLFAVVISQKALDEKVKLQGRAAIEQENPKHLNEFRTIVLNNLVKFWDDKEDIKIAIHETLSDFSYRKDLIGWIRGNNAVNTGFLAEEIARLTKENAELRSKLTIGDAHPLYVGLTYLQLEELLKQEHFKFVDELCDLFEYIQRRGHELTRGFYSKNVSVDDKVALARLIQFKLVKFVYSEIYLFTDDGHSFYLKLLLLSKKRTIRVINE